MSNNYYPKMVRFGLTLNSLLSCIQSANWLRKNSVKYLLHLPKANNRYLIFETT